MDRIAQIASTERAELFRASAAALQPDRSPAIIEKDFWVCWALHRIYDVLRFRPELIFKGGTSLSKAYEAIERFSEDVDLSLSRRHLGFTESRDPEEEGISRNESRRRIDALVAACQETIRTRFVPELRADFASIIGARGGGGFGEVREPGERACAGRDLLGGRRGGFGAMEGGMVARGPRSVRLRGA